MPLQLHIADVDLVGHDHDIVRPLSRAGVYPLGQILLASYNFISELSALRTSWVRRCFFKLLVVHLRHYFNASVCPPKVIININETSYQHEFHQETRGKATLKKSPEKSCSTTRKQATKSTTFSLIFNAKVFFTTSQ